MGIGFAILANSRPYEGLVFSLPVAAALAWLIWTRRRGWAVLLPMIPILGATALAMGTYFARFSGNPFLLRFVRRTNGARVGVDIHLPAGVEVAQHALISLGLAVEVRQANHYAAPAMGLVVLLVVEALRQLRQSAGASWVRAVVLACFLTPVIGGNGVGADGRERARILRQLESTGERSADIDHSPVVWAREMDPTSNQELLRYFQGRRVWLVSRTVRRWRFRRTTPPCRSIRRFDSSSWARTPLILDRVAGGYPQPYSFSCDQWNYFFLAVTGVAAPNVEGGCSPQAPRGQAVSFEQWFAWLEKQR